MEETAIMVRYYQKNCFHYVVAELHNSSELCFHIGVAAKIYIWLICLRTSLREFKVCGNKMKLLIELYIRRGFYKTSTKARS
jgi:hypothetical protein